MLGKCVLTVLELNWNQRFRGKKVGEIEHLSSYSHIFHTNSSCHIAERTRMSAKFPKMKTESAKPAKLLFFIVKCASL